MSIVEREFEPKPLDRQATDFMVKGLINLGLIVENRFTEEGLFEVRINPADSVKDTVRTLWSPWLMNGNPSKELLVKDERGCLFLQRATRKKSALFEVPIKKVWIVKPHLTGWRVVTSLGFVLDGENRESLAAQMALAEGGYRPKIITDDIPGISVDERYKGQEVFQIGLVPPPGSPEWMCDCAILLDGKLIPRRISYPLSSHTWGEEY